MTTTQQTKLSTETYNYIRHLLVKHGAISIERICSHGIDRVEAVSALLALGCAPGGGLWSYDEC